MTKTITGHKIKIIGLEEIDLKTEDDTYICDINESIQAGNFTGTINIDDNFYEWELESSINPDEMENLTYENKKIRDFLQRLELNSDEIINASNDELERMIKGLKCS
jgi:hypothetical protein